MENELKSKDKELESKDKKIDDLKNELDYLNRQLLNKYRKIFGKSSEQVDVNQMSLFDEAEKNSDPKAPSTAFYKTMASNELIAHMLIMKYQHAMPLYRQQNYFLLNNIDMAQSKYSFVLA